MLAKRWDPLGWVLRPTPTPLCTIMDSYPAHRLLTGREITRHRLRGLQASKQHQKLNRRTSEGLMSSESLSSVLQKFDLNADGDDRKMSKEFVSALRDLNAAPAAGRRSMSALSSPDIRAIVQTVGSPDRRDYQEFSRCRSYGDASDGSELPKCLKGRAWHDHGAILAGEDNTERGGSWPGAHAEEMRRHEKKRYLRGVLKEFEHDGVVDAPQFAEAMRALNSHLTPHEIGEITREARRPPPPAAAPHAAPLHSTPLHSTLPQP